MAACAELPAALAALLREHGGLWTGTAAVLLAYLPEAAVDPTRLAKRLDDAAPALGAAGVTLAWTREAGTGRRLLALRLAIVTLAAEAASAIENCPTSDRLPDPVRFPRGAPAPPGAMPPNWPCPACGGSRWQWRATCRRRTSGWRCGSCERYG